MSCVAGFKPREEAFSLKIEDDRKKLESVRGNLKAKGKKINIKLNKVIEEELNNYGLPKDEDSMADAMNLDFMLGEDGGDEVDQQVIDLFRDKTPEELWAQYQDNDGIITLTKGDKNGGVMAVMQCLMEAKSLAKHMLMKTYKGKEEGSYPVSDMMRKLYSQVFRKPLSTVKMPKHDGSFVFEALSKLFKRVNNNDSQQVLLQLCDALNQEFDKGKKVGSVGESAIHEVFKMELEDQFECSKQHLKVS